MPATTLPALRRHRGDTTPMRRIEGGEEGAVRRQGECEERCGGVWRCLSGVWACNVRRRGEVGHLGVLVLSRAIFRCRGSVGPRSFCACLLVWLGSATRHAQAAHARAHLDRAGLELVALVEPCREAGGLGHLAHDVVQEAERGLQQERVAELRPLDERAERRLRVDHKLRCLGL
eukprot:6001425-Prymnesium_polylepis.1